MKQSILGILTDGARRLWFRQRVFWWPYALGLFLAWLASGQVGAVVGPVLDHSLLAERLVQGYDMAVVTELMGRPEVSLAAPQRGATGLALLHAMLLLFLMGGILADFIARGKPATEEFFRACGAYFWRFLRLLAFFLLTLILPIIAFGFLWGRVGTMTSESPNELVDFYLRIAMLVGMGLLMMLVRLAIDVAQLVAVVEGQRAARRCYVRGFRLTFGNFRALFGPYLLLTLLSGLGMAVALWLWATAAPADKPFVTLLLGQVMVVFWLGTRLWQRACQASWFEGYHLATVSVPTPPVPVSAPAPAAAPADSTTPVPGES